MDYQFDQHDGVDVLSVSGNVLTGIHNSEILGIVTEMIKGGSDKIVVKLGEVKFINSNGLNLLLNILTKYRKAGGEIVLAHIPNELVKLLDMTKLSSIFISRPTIDEAVAYLKSA